MTSSFRGAGCLQFLIKIRRTKISKKIQSLADCQKPCLRASGRFQFVPGRSLCIPPMEPIRTASEAFAVSTASSVSGTPCTSIEAPPNKTSE